MRSRYRKIRARASISRQSKARGRSRRQSKARGSSHGLSKSAGAGAPAATGRTPRGRAATGRARWGAGATARALPLPLREGGGGRGPAATLHKPPVLHKPLHPPSFPLHELPDRQRVEELVRQQQHRPSRQRLQPVMPDRPRQPFRLQRPQPRRRLDQMQPHRRPERRRHLAHRPQSIGHQRAPPRPALHQQHRVRPSDQLPGHRRPQPQDLAKHLADLRRSGEVAERIVCRVVGRIGARHEAIEPLHHRVRRISHAPAISIGIDSNWPIVAPPIRYPRNTSGSRKNSPMMRATP